MSLPQSRCVIVTGGTANLGYYTALNIAKARPDYQVIIASRSDKDKAAERINRQLGQKNTVFVPLDLADEGSISAFAARWDSNPQSFPPIQAFVMNAGLQFTGGLVTTPDRLEMTFAISHAGHALLFHLLCSHMAVGSRIVVTTSGLHDPKQPAMSGMPPPAFKPAEAAARPPTSETDVPGRQRYATVKLVNLLWMYALVRQLAQREPERRITVNGFDPGLMPGTKLARDAPKFERFMWNNVLPRLIPLLRVAVMPNVHSPKESGANQAQLAVGSQFEGVTGKYYMELTETEFSAESYDEQKQDDIWNWTVNYFAKGDEAKKARFEALK
ncbi:hypothetical protein F5Y17DRAFT_452595 [Xylariaceae sp. FL0594]|nr:hypothetical protein F5Y17DRAFT_452595 [Xylariaceae sp. FL0594]